MDCVIEMDHEFKVWYKNFSHKNVFSLIDSRVPMIFELQLICDY